MRRQTAEQPPLEARPVALTGLSLPAIAVASVQDARSRATAIANTHAVREILILMLCTDALLIAAHLGQYFTPYFSGPSFHLATERGFGEVVQYVKVYWIALSFLWLSIRTAERAYLVWPMIFGYLLVDDAFRVHEQAGHILARSLGSPAAMGLGAQDIGELAVFALMGVTTLLLVSLAYLWGSATFRHSARRMGALLFLFGLFAGGVDMVHGLVSHIPLYNTLLTVLEDGGELLVLSVICAYTLALLLRHPPPVATAD